MKLKLISILFLICSAKVPAQKTGLHPSLKNLLEDDKPVGSIGFEHGRGEEFVQYVSITDYPFSTFPQNLIKNSEGLFVYIIGSGRLYQATSDRDSVVFTRMDSTFFGGYNFGCYPFSYHDSIYTLGGYGFWRINGQLRVFVNQTKQWDIVKLNREIPIMTDMIWYDYQNKKIYIGYTATRDEAIKNKDLNEADFLYDVNVLDLVTKDWNKLGRLSNYFLEKRQLLKNITSSPWGQLTELGNKFIIIDYANNRFLSLKPSVEDALRPLIAASAYAELYYFKDSTLFFGNTFGNTLDSFPLHLNDFIVSNEKVYNSENSLLFSVKYWVIGLTIIAVFIFILLRKKKSRQEENIRMQELKNDTPKDIQVIFEEKELQVIRLIADNSLHGKITSIDELNKILGLTKKSIEIQKKQRSDIILSINRKYNFLSGSGDSIIQKKRSDLDKRSFEYFIDYNKAKGALDFLNK